MVPAFPDLPQRGSVGQGLDCDRATDPVHISATPLSLPSVVHGLLGLARPVGGARLP